MKLQNQAAIITGATSGIGYSIAILFAREGANVVVVGRNEERGKNTIDKIKEEGGEGIFVQADITQEEEAKCVVERTLKTYGRIDILVNNAGTVFSGSIPETDLDSWNRIYHTNVTTTYLMSRFVLPHMIEQASGSIVNMGSEAGLKGLKDRAAYSAAKSAIVGLTKAMAVDHSPLGIRVNCICPGAVETPLVKNVIESHPDPESMRQQLIDRRLLPFLGTPEDIASCALYLTSPDARYITGSIISIDGGSLAK